MITAICATGSSGPVVTEWQKALAGAGFSVKVDGQFGSATMDATRQYQMKLGLPSTGVFDLELLAAHQLFKDFMHG